MNESHVSLRTITDVTGIELDTLVGESWKIDGVIGSRMTGRGIRRLHGKPREEERS
jgi:galactokinase